MALIHLFMDAPRNPGAFRFSPLPSLVYWLLFLLLPLMGYCGSHFVTPTFVFRAIIRRDEVELTSLSLVAGKAKPPTRSPSRFLPASSPQCCSSLLQENTSSASQRHREKGPGHSVLMVSRACCSGPPLGGECSGLTAETTLCTQ